MSDWSSAQYSAQYMKFGSGLRPYLAALTDSEQTEFLQDLHSRIDSLYPIRHNGKCILKMPRLFFTAKKK